MTKPQAIESKPPGEQSQNTAQNATVKPHRPYSYQKVEDGRKQAIRGLWKRGDRFVARITEEEASGKKVLRWVPLGSDTAPVETVAQAKEAFRKLLTQRDEGRLPVLKMTPKLSEYVVTYKARVAGKKRASTLAKEGAALDKWIEHFGGLRIDKIRKSHVNDFITERLADGLSGRTVNLDVIALRNLIKQALEDDLLKVSPLQNLRPLDWEKKKRALVPAADLDKLCRAAFETRTNEDGEPVPVTKNAQQFADYIKLMAYCGSRRDETLRLRWGDVNWAQNQLTVGADGLSKNGEAREVDFNADLESHLKQMHSRRQPDSDFLFPSPQRGDKDASAKTFKESLAQAKDRSGLKAFGFHDCRHFFISMAVMSGVDFMTIAKWVGHQDGGVLIGKVYGHLADEHRKRMALKVVFSPRVVEKESEAAPVAG